MEWRTTYADRLKVFIKDLREATDLYDIPFIVGGLGDFLELYNETTKNYIYVKILAYFGREYNIFDICDIIRSGQNRTKCNSFMQVHWDLMH